MNTLPIPNPKGQDTANQCLTKTFAKHSKHTATVLICRSYTIHAKFVPCRTGTLSHGKEIEYSKFETFYRGSSSYDVVNVVMSTASATSMFAICYPLVALAYLKVGQIFAMHVTARCVQRACSFPTIKGCFSVTRKFAHHYTQVLVLSLPSRIQSRRYWPCAFPFSTTLNCTLLCHGEPPRKGCMHYMRSSRYKDLQRLQVHSLLLCCLSENGLACA
jgi:hypothetical protein